MKTLEYRRGYQAGYKAAKTGSELPLDMAIDDWNGRTHNERG